MTVDKCEKCDRSELDTELNQYKNQLLCWRCRNNRYSVEHAQFTPYAEQGFRAFVHKQMTGEVPAWFPRSRVAEIRTQSGLYLGDGVVF